MSKKAAGTYSFGEFEDKLNKEDISSNLGGYVTK